MALLVQPMVRVPLQAPNPPLSPQVGPPLAAPAPAPHSLQFSPRWSHSPHLWQHPPLHPLWPRLVEQPRLLWSQSLLRLSLLNTFSPQLQLQRQPHKNVASCLAGSVLPLLLRLLLLYQVSVLCSDHKRLHMSSTSSLCPCAHASKREHCGSQIDLKNLSYKFKKHMYSVG